MDTRTPHCTQLWFLEPQRVACQTGEVPQASAGMVRVRAHCSAVSAGTELLVYRGQLPPDLALDAIVDTMQDRPAYPLQYGYASVGTVDAIGENVATEWLGKRVFAFAPHASHFVSEPGRLIAVPDGISDEDAVFLANMETAVNLAQDAHVVLGERVVVLGQGVVGLLLTAILARFPLQQLLAVDGIAARRTQARILGAQQAFAPEPLDVISAALGEEGADVIIELSGVPHALNLAIDLSGFGSRIIVGSWYGTKSAPIAFGGKAHRNRLQVITSQVSTIAPELSARWNKTRRFALVWEMLEKLQPSQLISHRLPLSDAGGLYKQLHEAPDQIMQALFVYR